jgi:anaerobic ribonucleoside-triphosphate reductase
MYQVIKRNGITAAFDIAKISSAIQKAFDALEKKYTDNVIDFLALKVTADFEGKIKDELAMPMWPRPTSSTASSAKNCAR